MDIALIRKCFERAGGPSLGEVARRLGWVRPDHARVSRTLGYSSLTRASRQWMNYDLAVRICDAIGADYTELPSSPVETLPGSMATG